MEKNVHRFPEHCKTTNLKTREAYRELPFSVETPTDEFYKYMNVSEIVKTDRRFTSVRIRCRTIGVLHSINGEYCLKNLDRHENHSCCQVHVTFEYSPMPPQPAVVPYTAQIFGFLGFENNRPVIFAMVVQALPHNTACKINSLMHLISRTHLATSESKVQKNKECKVTKTIENINI